MKIVRHPNIVRLHEVCVDIPILQELHCTSFSPYYISHIVYKFQVLSSQTKIYIILEFVMGGELYDRIVRIFMFICYEMIQRLILLRLLIPKSDLLSKLALLRLRCLQTTVNYLIRFLMKISDFVILYLKLHGFCVHRFSGQSFLKMNLGATFNNLQMLLLIVIKRVCTIET